MFKVLLRNEKLRYLVVGGLNTVLGFGLFSVCQFFFGKSIGYLGSLYLAQLIASVIAFVNYKKAVFNAKGNIFLDFVRFQSVYLVPLLINTLLLPLFVQAFHWNVYFAQAVATFILSIGLYFGHKHFSFRRQTVEIIQNED